MAGLFETPQVPRLPTLLDEVRKGGILIPDFQRPLEWNDNQRLMLLDSVAKQMPIGALLVWRTSTQELRCLDSLGAFKLPKTPGAQVPRSYLLDGHQRLATLLAALTWTEDTLTLQQQGIRWPIYCDLEADNDERLFRFHARKTEPPMTWLPMYALLEPRRLYARQKRLMESGKEAAADRAEALAEVFKDYQIPIVPLVSEDLDLVTESFVRVNTEGKRMRETNMIRALSFSPERDIERELATLKDELAPLGWGTLDDQILLNLLKAHWGLNVLDSQPRVLFDRLQEDGYDRTLIALRDCVGWAIERLGEIGVRGPRSLPYAYQLIGLAEVGWRLGQPGVTRDERKRIKDWFWLTTYGEYFTGLSGRRIRDAIDHLHQVIKTSKGPMPSDLATEVSPISAFNYRATRSKALMLLTTTRIEDADLRQKTQRWLGERGNEAVHNLFPTEDARRPENRVVAVPEELQALREALDPASIMHLGLGREALEGHHVGEEALDEGRRLLMMRYLLPAEAPKVESPVDRAWIDRILSDRRTRLIELEQQLLSGLGLTLRRDEDGA